MSDVICIHRYAPSGTNYASSVGLPVYESGADECTVAVDGTTKPIGIITHAENSDAGLVTIQTFGISKCITVGIIAYGSPFVKASTSGKVAVSTTTLQANSTFEWVVGTLVLRDGVSTAAGGMYDILINPQLNTVGGSD